MFQPTLTELVSSSLVDKVLTQARVTASHSWEYGVVFEALLEYHNPSLTIFHSAVAEQQKHLSSLEGDIEALVYVEPFVRTDGTTLCEGNGSSSDPASLGIPALLLDSRNSKASYLPAVQRQINNLLETAPRLPNGAISHREATASAWADFIYMVPPFLVYYGVYTDDKKMVREAMRQCRLYCEILSTTKGLWKHIVTTSEWTPRERKEDDAGLWSTSNGWAAAGMARVLATVRGSRFEEEMREELGSLAAMIENIVHGAIENDMDDSGLLRNYLDDETWWGEVAGTALLAATAFRMAVLDPGVFGTRYTDWALQKMDTVSRCIDLETGIAAPVVNPLKESQRIPLSGPSPEGQAFVMLLYAAWRDWEE